MEQLLQVALGPVQDFISTARRTRDLYAGSRLLSEAAGQVAAYLAERLGYGNLIFPAPNNAEHFRQLSQSGIPNVVVARVREGVHCRALAEEAVQQARRYIEERGTSLLDKHRGQIDVPTALEQLSDMLEVYWACVPLEEDYARTRNRLAAVMAARKNTRGFMPVGWGSSSLKAHWTRPGNGHRRRRRCLEA